MNRERGGFRHVFRHGRLIGWRQMYLFTELANATSQLLSFQKKIFFLIFVAAGFMAMLTSSIQGIGISDGIVSSLDEQSVQQGH